MKNILIVYATKTGSTATAAQLLCDRLTGREVTLCTTDAPEADPTAYDIVVIGGCIRYGKLYRPVREYLQKWDAVLASNTLHHHVSPAVPPKSLVAGFPADSGCVTIPTESVCSR